MSVRRLTTDTEGEAVTRLQKWAVGLWVVLMLVGGGLTLAIQDDSRSGELDGWSQIPESCRSAIPSPMPTGEFVYHCGYSGSTGR